jgi:3D (Asp-Asp-Asp) domain-containing protein
MRNIIILILIIHYSIANGQQLVTATVYNAVAGQTDSTPLITASGRRINYDSPQRWIAVSRDLEPLGFTFGTKVCIENAGEMNGEWVVQDRMNKRFKLRIDFLVHASRRLGKWRGVLITKQ